MKELLIEICKETERTINLTGESHTIRVEFDKSNNETDVRIIIDDKTVTRFQSLGVGEAIENALCKRTLYEVFLHGLMGINGLFENYGLYK